MSLSYVQIFAGTVVLAKAQRHLSNRASRYCVVVGSTGDEGLLRCQGAEREAIDLMTSLLLALKHEKKQLLRKRRKAA